MVHTKIIYAILFSVLFMGIPFLLDELFYAYAPIDELFEIQVNVSNISSNDTFQVLSTHNNIKKPAPAVVYRELVIVDENHGILVYSSTRDIFMERGEYSGRIQYQIPDNLKKGEYYWRINVAAEYGFSTRLLEIETNHFWVT